MKTQVASRGGDVNLFHYVGNDSLNQVDPSGLVAKWASYGGGRPVNNQISATSSSNVPNGSPDAPYRTGNSFVASSSGQAEGNAYLASSVFQEMRYSIYKSFAGQTAPFLGMTYHFVIFLLIHNRRVKST